MMKMEMLDCHAFSTIESMLKSCNLNRKISLEAKN